MDINYQFYDKIVAAFIRGKIKSDAHIKYDNDFYYKELNELSEPEICEIIQMGVNYGLRLHKFKRTMELPRVRKVLGIIKGLQPKSLLDVGSGRGNFLWPLMDSFPNLNVTAIDIDIIRVNDINAVHEGGFNNLSASIMDATKIEFKNNSFDTVTALEVLEHIQNWKRALSEIVRVSSNFVIISVPSKEDDNPEHIHLFNMDMLKIELQSNGIKKVNFEYVLNHIIAIARKEPC